MAAQGKHSPFMYNVMPYLAGIFLVAWAAMKLLATYFDLTLLVDTTGWLLGFWDWLWLETPMPNWSLLMIIAILISTLSVAIYYACITDGACGELHELEQPSAALSKISAPGSTSVVLLTYLAGSMIILP
jgi:hypothetical protein